VRCFPLEQNHSREWEARRSVNGAIREWFGGLYVAGAWWLTDFPRLLAPLLRNEDSGNGDANDDKASIFQKQGHSRIVGREWRCKLIAT
jgi:hypothetical protein